MKSSTLRRSTLSKEKMSVLKALAAYKQDSSYDESPNVYVRPSKEKELDLLWQNFKVNQKSEKSPSIYMTIGFVAGIICTLLITAIIGLSTRNVNSAKVEAPKTEQVNLIPADTAVSTASESYVVQNGDTVESILIRFYGSYSPEKAMAVQKANNLQNINRLQIGQKLVIPME